MMKNVFQDTCKAVANGAPFKIDLSAGTLKVGKTTVIKNGQLDDMNPGTEEFDGLPVLEVIENLYAQYKTSIPSEKSDAGRSRYFRALPECELEDEDMLYGIPRSVAQVRLELFVLLSVIEGKLTWDETTMGKWFWQSDKDKDLIILRDWIERK